jgi:manganese/zinc/iron transport system substrate-binding protein
MVRLFSVVSATAWIATTWIATAWIATAWIAAGGCAGPSDRAREGGDRLASQAGRGSGPGNGSDVSTRPILIVATTGMVADLARNIGGGRVRVTALMGPGIDPHLYRAREGDVGRLAGADLVLYSGLHLEAKVADVLERMRGKIRAAAVTDGIAPARLLELPGHQSQHDPHVWFDVALWRQAGERVRDLLVELDPAHAETYRANAASHLAALDSLDAYVRVRAAAIPAEKRVLITAHDAFGYFGRAYGFEVRGLQGVSTSAEAGTADLQHLADFIATRRIPAIFVESSISPRSIQAVREAVRSRGYDVRLGESLYSDALGSPDTPEGSYVGMVRHNIDTIAEALSR